MPNYTYVIVGGGMTADAAVQGIREVDAIGSIGLIGAETHPPYNRPPLSKGLWKGKPLESIWRQSAQPPPQLHLGRTARTLDAGNRRITDDQGTTYTYSNLLLATGGTPRRLPFGGDDITHNPQSGGSGEIAADGVVAGIGITPNVELAQQAGLQMDNGIVVDAALRSSDPNIYAAGDVAAFHNPALGRRLRVEHEDNALNDGPTGGPVDGRASGDL